MSSEKEQKPEAAPKDPKQIRGADSSRLQRGPRSKVANAEAKVPRGGEAK